MRTENESNWWERRPSVLFVDDEENILRTLNRIFRSEDCELHFAESGEEALKILEENIVDVLITDQRMPEMTGVELLKIVKARWPHIVRVVLSGYTDVESLLSAINEGEIYRFVSKPCDNEVLRKVVVRCIEEGKILKGFMRLVEKLREAAPDHEVETMAEVERGKLHASFLDHGKKFSKEQMTLLVQCLLDNINEQFRGVETEKLSGLIAKRMGKISFTADVGAGVQLSVDIPIEEDTT